MFFTLAVFFEKKKGIRLVGISGIRFLYATFEVPVASQNKEINRGTNCE